MNKNTKKKFPLACVILLIIIAVVVVFNSFAYVTNENEYSVIKQFGKIVTVNDTAGLRFKTPIIQDTNYISKAVRMYDLNPSEVITSDKKTMIIDAYVLWKVTDATVYTQSLNASDNTAQSRLDVIVFNAIKTTVSSMTQDEVIASRNGSRDIEIVEADLADVELQDFTVEDPEATEVRNIAISEKLIDCIGNQCDQYGIKVTDIEIKMLDLPDENKSAVYERMITERNNIATAYKAQGQSEAQKIRNTTDKEVTVMLSEAEASAEKTVAEGEAEYMKILADAYNDEEKADFYLYALELDSLKESLNGKKDNMLIIDANSPFASIFNGIEE